MNRILFILLFFSISSSSQNIERKIIIQNNQFYFITIDSQFQLATLHIGKITDPLSKAHQYILPVGRSLMEPVNPLAWDIIGDKMYVISFFDHPLYDKNQAPKLIEISSLKEKTDSYKVSDHLNESLNQPYFALNNPYLYVLGRSSIMNNFFFDGIALTDSTYLMEITNNGELTTWIFDGTTWKHSEIQKVDMHGYFSLYSTGLLFEDTASYLIVNKDQKTVMAIKKDNLNFNIPLKKLIEEKAVKIP